MRGLNWQTLQLSLAGGLDTKEDARASDPRQLDVARDVQYDELGGVQQRPPFGAVLGGGQIFGGGTLANCRRVEAYGDELVLFTDTQVFSWNAQLSKWVARGTHLAVSVDEQQVFGTTGDQVEADRAELNGTIVYVWTEGAQVFAAASDKVTGSVLQQPIAVPSATGHAKVIALSTKILLFAESASGTMTVRAIDPANPKAAITGGGTIVTASASPALKYDVAKLPGRDSAFGAIHSNANTYIVFTVSSALSILTSAKARACTGSIAVSPVPATNGPAQVIRVSAGGSLRGDVIDTTSLADTNADQVIADGITTGIVTARHRSVADALGFRCVVFCGSQGASGSTSGRSFVASVWSSGVISLAVGFVPHLEVASKAFDYNGSVYVWMVFAKQSIVADAGAPFGSQFRDVQNTYFLYRDDGLLCAKAAPGTAGGYPTSMSFGLTLPEVSAVSPTKYVWCGLRRRRADVGSFGHRVFAERAPVDISFSFDANEARRSALIGQTMYIAGGEVLTYDGVRLVECGFHVFPWVFTGTAGAGGSLAAGVYSYKETWRYQNAKSETERSTTATVLNVTTGASGSVSFTPLCSLTVTHKTEVRPTDEMWRTKVAPNGDVPFFLVSSNDPALSAGANRHIVNNHATGDVAPFQDVLSDADIADRETNPENGAVLEYLAPPGASIIFATDTRVFLAGVAGRPDEVWYSRLRGDNEVASFHDGNVIPIPHDGGRITALAYLNETLIVFRESAVYALPGVGFGNLGNADGSQNFGPANRLSSDVGAASMESVVLTPMGLLFKSRKGWYLLDRSWSARYVGAPVAAFDGDAVRAAHVVEGQHQVRILTDARMLVWDYHAVSEVAPLGKWAEWTVADGVHATIWQGQHVYLTATGPRVESTLQATAPDYGEDVETAWVKMQDLQGAARVRAIQILGELRSSHLVRVRVARDYQYDDTGAPLWFDDAIFDLSPPGEPVPIVGSAMQLRAQLSSSDVQAIKVRITPVVSTQTATLATATLSPAVTTSGTNWAATWEAVARGEHGNAVSMSFAFESNGLQPFSIDVRDHFAWSVAEQRWIEDIDNVGVRVLVSLISRPTVAQLEAAIAAETKLVTLLAGDVAASKLVSTSDVTTSKALSGGAYGPPTTESCKLTGLGIEVGLKPGLYRRLSAEQKA